MAVCLSTCWTVIEAAAAGSRAEREEFVRRYGPVVRAYLAARWRNNPLARELDDAAREVLLLHSVPLATKPSTAYPLPSAIPILLFHLLRQPGYTPYQTTYTFLKSEGCLC